MSSPTVTVSLQNGAIIVRYNNILHFRCRRSDILAVQSWKWDEAFVEKTARYSIEYTVSNKNAVANITCEYDTYQHWITILSELEKLL